jgi:hypothetical protein
VSFDKTQIIVQTLEGQLSDLKERSEAVLLAVPEHEGAAAVCEQLAKACLGFADLVEDKLAGEEDASDETKQLVRVYCKNLIVRLHNLCDSNAKNQRNQVLVTKGRLKEIESQAQVLSKLIEGHKNFDANRERREREALAALGADLAGVDVEVPGTSLPNKDVDEDAPTPPPAPSPEPEKPAEPEPEPEAPEPAPGPQEAAPEPVKEEITKPDTPKAKAKQASRRKLSRGKKKS